MQDYFRHLNRIEFVITGTCTGRCKHCSAEAPSGCGGVLVGNIYRQDMREILAHYKI